MTDLHHAARTIHRGDQLLAEVEDRAAQLARHEAANHPGGPKLADGIDTPEFHAGVAFGSAATALVYRDHGYLTVRPMSAMTPAELDAYAIAVLKRAGYRVFTVDGTDEIAYVERTMP